MGLKILYELGIKKLKYFMIRDHRDFVRILLGLLCSVAC